MRFWAQNKAEHRAFHLDHACSLLRYLWRSYAVLLVLLIGCTSPGEYLRNGFKVGPNYWKPAAPVEPDWIDAADRRVSNEDSNLRSWWTVFRDPVLDAMVRDAYQQNLTLRQAGFRVLEARAFRNIQVGNLFPQTQNLSGGFQRYEVSKLNANTSFLPQRFFSQKNAAFNLSWEIDFWGRFRRAVEAADADLDAAVEDYDAVLVTLLGDLATAYVQLRTLETQIRLVEANIKLQTDTVAMTAARYRAGHTSKLDLDQAESNLRQTRALLPQFEIEQRLQNNLLCILMGIPPEQLQARIGRGAIPQASSTVAVGIPAQLLSRRPDVRRAERQVAAQSARIGIAQADLYPHIFINGTIGTSAARFPDLLKDQSFYGNIGPQYTWNIFNYGRILNNVRLQQARLEELIAAYQQTVLDAQREAENGLVVFLRSQTRTEELALSVAASREAVELSMSQYRGGTVDFNRVALLQLQLVQQQDLLAQARGDIADGLVQVYRALGGGWELRLEVPDGPLPPVPSPAPEPQPGLEANPIPVPAAAESLPSPAAP